MKIYLYSFSKKRNSTAIPSGAGYEVEVQLKENCSVYHPAFILNHNAADFNYIRAVFPSSGGASDTYYYFVDDITFNTDRIITAVCSCDTLATLRSEIFGTRANIMYCADSPVIDIIDTRIPVRTNVAYIENSIDLGVPNSGGLHIKDLSNNEIPAIMLAVTGKGCFGVYLLKNYYEMSEILDGVDIYTNGWVDIFSGLKQLFFGGTAAECLKAAIALPIALTGSDVGASTEVDLFLGNYPCLNNNGGNIKVYKVYNQIFTAEYSINIPWGSSPFGVWQRCSPYNDFYLYIPFIGIIHLNASDIVNDNVIEIEFAINVTSGDIGVIIKAVQTSSGTRRVVATSSGNMALNTPFGSTGIDTNRLTQSIGTGLATAGVSIAMAATGNLPGAALTLAGGIAGAAGGTLSALGGTGAGDGGLGGGASSGLDKSIRLVNINRTLSDSPANFAQTYGKPFMRPDTISNHSGLVITEGFSLSASAPKDMIEEVNRIMDGGVYIE